MPNSLCGFQRVISACLTRHQPVRVAELTNARFKIKTPRAKRIVFPSPPYEFTAMGMFPAAIQYVVAVMPIAR